MSSSGKKINKQPTSGGTVNTPVNKSPDDVEKHRNEYAEVNCFIRHFSTLRYYNFTVFLAAFGGLAYISFGFVEIRYANPQIIMLFGRIGGLLATLLFFFYELRIQSMVKRGVGRAAELERLLGYEYFQKRTDWRILKGNNVTVLFFLILIVFWTAAVFYKPLFALPAQQP